MKMPGFFILGAPKTGTTAMARYLSEHPEVFMARRKEPHHFSSDLRYGSFRDRDAYAGLFRAASEEHKAVGEASVWYLYSKAAVPRIEAELPGAKYIVMLRNPIMMAPALHQQHVFAGQESLRSFEDAWRVQDSRRQGNDLPRFTSDGALLLYRDACSLGSQLTRLYAKVERDRVFVIFNEDFRKDPAAVWRSVQTFLGVADDGRADFPMVNAAKERRSFALMRLVRGYAALRRRFAILPSNTGVRDALNRWNVSERSRTALSPQMQQELYASFAPDIDLLERCTGRDLSSWRPHGAAGE